MQIVSFPAGEKRVPRLQVAVIVDENASVDDRAVTGQIASVMPSAQRSPRRARLVMMALLTVIQLTSGTTAGIFSTVQQSAKIELGLSDLQLSLIQGLATAIPLGLLSIPVGLISDRSNRVRLLVILSAFGAAGTLATTFASDWHWLFIARMVTGFGAFTSISVVISLTADLYAPALRGRAMLVLQVGRYAGAAAAFALGGVLLGYLRMTPIFGFAPWRGVHLVVGIASIVVTLALFVLREPERTEVAGGPKAPIRAIAGELWDRRLFLLPLFAAQCCVAMTDSAALIWTAPLLSRNYGLSPEQFAGWMGILVLGTALTGSILGGVSADLGTKSGRRGGILYGAFIASIIVAPTAVFPIMSSVPTFAMALALMLLGGSLIGTTTATAIAVLLPNEIRGLFTGILTAIAGLVAFGIAPTLVVLVSTYLGGEGHLAAALAIVGSVTGVLTIFAFFAAIRHAPRRPGEVTGSVSAT
jgi:MFS family permease